VRRRASLRPVKVSLAAAAIAARACTFIAAAWLAAPAAAQDDTTLINTPAEQFVTSPGGVDMRTGRFAYSETDLSIGGEGGALALTRAMAPSVRGHANPFGNLSHNWDIMVSELRIDFNDLSKFGNDYQINVHFGGRSQTYRGRANYQNFEQSSGGGYAPLTYSGTRTSGTVLYTYQAADGSVAVFRALGTLGNSDCSAERRCAFISQLTEPDGTVYTFDYAASNSSNGVGGTMRLTRVTSSRGYALVFEGAQHRVTKACVVNLALGPAPADCSSATLATATYTYETVNGSPLPTYRLTGATGPDSETSAFSYGLNQAGATTMGFVRPDETSPWLTNTLGTEVDEEWSPVETVTHQAYADGSSYSYNFEYGPLAGDRPQTIAGGSYTHSGGNFVHQTRVPFAWPLKPQSNNPGSPCMPILPACSVDGIDGFVHWTYQQTPGPVR
jgi:hypothetical protein